MIAPTTEVAAFNTKLEADLAVAKLAEAGIDAFIVADNLGGTLPMMQMITGGYRVMALEEVAEEATEILSADEDIPAAEVMPRSPALFRVLGRLSPTQIVAVLALLVTSIITTLYAITQGTL